MSIQIRIFAFLARVVEISQIIFHSIVQRIGHNESGPIVAILRQLLQLVIMLCLFVFLILFLGMRQGAVRGNIVMFMLSGIYLFLLHNFAVGEGQGLGLTRARSTARLHQNPMVELAAVIGASFYRWSMILMIVMLLTDLLVEPVIIQHPDRFAFAIVLAYFSGLAVGLFFDSLTPILGETAMGVVGMLYKRGNLMFSGKMTLASYVPAAVLPMFIWNPLFHIIDYARDAVFINYNAKVTNIHYPIWLSIILVMIAFGIGRLYVNKSAQKAAT